MISPSEPSIRFATGITASSLRRNARIVPILQSPLMRLRASPDRGAATYGSY
jgi:hypothetical protein